MKNIQTTPVQICNHSEKTCCGDTGAVGSVNALLFHPSEPLAQNFPAQRRRSTSKTAPSSVMTLNKSMGGTNIATLSMPKVLIAISKLLQKIMYQCCTMNYF